MDQVITSRRSVITGLVSLLAAPAIVRAGSLMPVKAIDVEERVKIGSGYHFDQWGGLILVKAATDMHLGDLVSIDPVHPVGELPLASAMKKDFANKPWIAAIVFEKVKQGSTIAFNAYPYRFEETRP